MKRELIPAILARSAEELIERLRLVEGRSKWVQIDVLDNSLVQNTSWFSDKTVRELSPKIAIELHLMVDDPKTVLTAWKDIHSLKRAIWHIEAPIDHNRLITYCHTHNLEIGLAISPGTPTAALVPYLRKIDEVLVLGVQPGFSGQKIIPATLNTVDDIHRLVSKMPIAFDGGIESRSIPILSKRGVSRFCMASSIFDQKNPRAVMTRLQKKLTEST